jgi:hemolysin III
MPDSQTGKRRHIKEHRYSLGEEIANSITHGLGMLLSCGGLAVLVVFASLYATVWHIVSVSIFGVTMIMLFMSSTFYHALTKTRHKKLFRIFDHASIFLLIAGTYTPLMLTIRGGVGWSVFGIIWGLAVAGVVMKVFWLDRFAKTSVILFLCMGWFCLFTFKKMFPMMPTSSIVLLISGGVTYSIGVIFFLWNRLPYNHAIWHMFVLVGCTLHYFSILLLCTGS